MKLSTSDWIGVSGVAATIIAAVTAWLVSAWATKRSLAQQALGYRMIMSPLLAIDKVPGEKENTRVRLAICAILGNRLAYRRSENRKSQDCSENRSLNG
jgi:hypothetical protein